MRRPPSLLARTLPRGHCQTQNPELEGQGGDRGQLRYSSASKQFINFMSYFFSDEVSSGGEGAFNDDVGGRADLLIQSQPHKNREDLSMSDRPPDDLEYSPLTVLSSSHALNHSSSLTNV